MSHSAQQISSRHSPYLGRVALLWAGMVVGGSLIAAPAKFQVEELTMPVALLVGRAQFAWLAIAELILIIVGIIGSLVLFMKFDRSMKRKTLWLFLFAVALFALQHVVLMPILQERSAQIIAGGEPPENKLHLLYVVAECVKVVLLLVAGFTWPGKQLFAPDKFDQ